MITLLPNTVGYAASAITASTLSAGAVNSVISGPRSSFYKSAAAVTNTIGYTTLSPTQITATHVVIARADWLLTAQTSQVIAADRDAGTTWSTLINKNPIAASDLVGPTRQDYAATIAPASRYAYRITRNTTGGAVSESLQLSKLYFSAGFDFGTEPTLNPAPTWQKLPKGQNFNTPLKNAAPYSVEARLSLTWQAVTLANVAAFKALPMLLYWPLFLYDPDRTIWDWKLEHVIIENYQESLVSAETKDITVTFLRLRHYP